MYCILLDDWNPRNYPVGWISPHFLTPLTANIWFWAVSHAVLTSKDELCQRLSPYRFLPSSGCPFHFTAGLQVPAFESSWHSLWRLAPGRNFQEIHSGSGNLKGGSCWAAIFFSTSVRRLEGCKGWPWLSARACCTAHPCATLPP